MQTGNVEVTVIGNLTADPELRFTADGQPVASFRVASARRVQDRETGEWKDGETMFLTCTVWRQQAEHVAESFQRGSRVMVRGRLRQRTYETRQGETRTVIDIDAHEVAASVRWATVKISRAARASADQPVSAWEQEPAEGDTPPF